jgi:hypothetical protein
MVIFREDKSRNAAAMYGRNNKEQKEEVGDLLCGDGLAQGEATVIPFCERSVEEFAPSFEWTCIILRHEVPPEESYESSYTLFEGMECWLASCQGSIHWQSRGRNMISMIPRAVHHIFLKKTASLHQPAPNSK